MGKNHLREVETHTTKDIIFITPHLGVHHYPNNNCHIGLHNILLLPSNDMFLI